MYTGTGSGFQDAEAAEAGTVPSVARRLAPSLPPLLQLLLLPDAPPVLLFIVLHGITAGDEEGIAGANYAAPPAHLLLLLFNW